MAMNDKQSRALESINNTLKELNDTSMAMNERQANAPSDNDELRGVNRELYNINYTLIESKQSATRLMYVLIVVVTLSGILNFF